VHTGVQQASSSVELSGDLIANGDVAAATPELIDVNFCIQLTSGGSAVDMAKTLIVFTAPAIGPKELTLNTAAPGTAVTNVNFAVVDRYNDNNDYLLESLEKFDIRIDTTGDDIVANGGFQIEIKPPQGATYTIHRQAPAAITDVMTLY